MPKVVEKRVILRKMGQFYQVVKRQGEATQCRGIASSSGPEVP